MKKDKKQSSKITILGNPIWYEQLSNFKKELISIGIIFLILLFLFNEIIFKNMLFSDAGDTAAAEAWSKAAEYLEKSEGQKPLWFPYIFSGMPGLGPLAYIPHNVNYAQSVIHFLGTFLFLKVKESWFVLHYLLAGIFMYLLARQMKFKPLPSLLAALVFSLSPYAVGLTIHGHGSKMMALSYIPLLLLLTNYLFEKRNLLSLGLFSIAIGTALLTYHVQMVYYGFMITGLFFIYQIITTKTNLNISFTFLIIFILALVIGFGISSYVYLSVHEYAQYSIRGGGEPGVAGGLSYDYATNWSFHPLETLNLLIPSFFGFSTPYYWGWMPFTDTTVYFGIIPIIFAIIALIYNRNRLLIFFILLTILIFLISFGKHFNLFYSLLFNYLPYFNKFRAPSMILHLLPLTFGIMAAYGLTFLLEQNEKLNHQKFKKRIYTIGGITLGILILGLIAKDTIFNQLSSFMFVKDGDLQQLQQQYGAQANQALNQLKSIRFDMLWNDYIKFTLLLNATFGIILIYLNNKISKFTFSSLLILILTIDLLIIDRKFIDPKPNNALEQRNLPDQTVTFLKQDKSHFRIFPIGQIFMDNSWMYHTIESIGGYSPAKIKIYQEILDSCLYKGSDPRFPLNMNIVNMLNTKYLIAQGRLPEEKFQIVAFDQKKGLVTHLNPEYQPRAFFVDNVLVAKNKSEVFSILNSPYFSSKTAAVLEKTPNIQVNKPDSSYIKFLNYKSNHIEMEAYSNIDNVLLVLSEVYYPAGWKAFIDGKETEIYKTNYILRSIILPSGTHKVEFKFYPEIYKTGYILTHISWVIAIILVGIGIYQNREKLNFIFRKKISKS